MRIVVSGAAGFVGRALLARLKGEHEVIATDRELPAGATGFAGDICDPALHAQLFARGCDAVIHLAAIPSGASEADPALAWKVNLEATRDLAAAAAQAGQSPRFIYASSIAALGPFKGIDSASDATTPAPKLWYGAHKLMTEAWLATMSRRGAIRAVSLRLAGVVPRPDNRSGMRSAFLSEVFHAVAQGRELAIPVEPGAHSWLVSVQCIAENLAHALTLDPAAVPESRAMTLPALRVRIEELVQAIASFSGNVPQVRYEPDAELQAGFASYPPLSTEAADRLGFRHDGSLANLVKRALTPAA